MYNHIYIIYLYIDYSEEKKLSQFIFTGAPDHQNWDNLDPTQFAIGFGNASRFIASEFKKHDLTFVTKKDQYDSGVNLAFCYPDEFNFLDNQYKIAYMPWESTDIWPHWYEPLNQVDEIWTTSEWSQKNLENIFNKKVFVYSHGIPEFCVPKIRKRRDIIRFLHIGSPALRKNTEDVINSFAELFGNNPKYQLVIKSSGMCPQRIYDKNGKSLGTPTANFSNIVIIEDIFPENMLLQLYEKCDIFVYPSYGEGFGFNAAQAIAMGMPTICVSEWAPYKEFITAPLDSTYVDSPWPKHHPGKMTEPDVKQIKSHMIDVSENYEKYTKIAFKNAIGIHEKFNWEKVSDRPAKRLKKIISATSKF